MGFSSELWDCFEPIYIRVREGKVFCGKVEEFFKKRIEIERDYAKKIQALTKTLSTAWTTIKTETENIGKKHWDLAEQLNTLVNDPIRTWLRDNEKPRKKLRDQARKLIKDHQAARENCPKAKAAYEAQRKIQDKTQEEYEKATFNNAQSPQVEKLAKKVSAETKKSEQLDTKYQEAVKTLADMQQKNFFTELPSCLEELEKMEDSRIQLMRQALESAVHLQGTLGPEITRSTDRMKQDVGAISSKADITDFVAKTRTGNSKAPMVEYEPYDPVTQTCHAGAPHTPIASNVSPVMATSMAKKPAAPIGGMSISSPSVSPPSSNTNVASQTSSSPSYGMATRSAPISSKPSAVSKPPAAVLAPQVDGAVGRCRALFDYDAGDETELSFRTGDVIIVLQKDPSGWWQGNLNGRVGVFPSVDWVEELPMEAPKPQPAPVATFASTPSQAANMGASSAPKWSSKPPAASSAAPVAAPVNTYAAPSPPVSPPVATRAAPPPAADPKREKCKALYQYNAENEFELTIYEGDVLSIEAIDEDGWYSGWNAKGQYGRFPSNYTEKM